MKSFFLPLTGCLLVLFSCKKDAQDNGCIERLTVAQNAHSINTADVARGDKLFRDNNLDITHFRYYRYTNNAPNEYIRVEQYINGLRVFNSDMVMTFYNGKLYYTGGDMIPPTSLDKTHHLGLQQVRRLFSDDLENDRFLGMRNYKDSCMQAEFGYYYKNNTLVKAWRVTPKNLQFPQGIYEDAKAGRINYTNGIIVF